MSAQRFEQKGRYFSSAGLLHTGHCAWMRTARNGTGRSGGFISARDYARRRQRQQASRRPGDGSSPAQ
jgi:hypothetical protein